MELEHKYFQFKVIEVKQEDRNGVPIGIFEGYLATWDKDRGDDIILEGAFTDTIKELMDTGRQLRMLAGHKYSELIGGFPPQYIRQDSKGLFVRGEINLSVQKGAESYALAKQGVLCDMSVGYDLPQDSVEFKIDPDNQDNVVRIIKKMNLWEGSLVPEPMNPKAQITAVKARELTGLKDIENTLKKLGCTVEASKIIISNIKAQSLRDVGSVIISEDVDDEDLALKHANLTLLLNGATHGQRNRSKNLY